MGLVFFLINAELECYYCCDESHYCNDLYY
jgi:hypothetical protein